MKFELRKRLLAKLPHEMKIVYENDKSTYSRKRVSYFFNKGYSLQVLVVNYMYQPLAVLHFKDVDALDNALDLNVMEIQHVTIDRNTHTINMSVLIDQRPDMYKPIYA